MRSCTRLSVNQLWVVYLGAVILSGLLSQLELTELVPLIAILALGLPHGALDIIMLHGLSFNKRRAPDKASFVVSIIVYVAVAACCLFAWFWLPTYCLCLFLILAAYHFGEDWINLVPRKGGLIGIIVLGLPALFQPDPVAMYFSALDVPNGEARSIVFVMAILGLLSLAILLIDFRQLSVEVLAWLVMLVLTSYFLPVLYYFCVYFCALHGPLHTWQVKRRYKLSWWSLAKVSVIPMAGAAILAVGLFSFLPQAFSGNKWLPMVFVGLFSLTVPHLILTIMHEHYTIRRSDSI
ncbi:Brp/Blh family beta-carotene 15,15'-dioxygenase [Vibrio sp. AND4]|uniref:Brp/Blh family beta-carotene 15,15'-dioxygenase n=1 Tax=Vibrio sp. AND4 TaxID=314289 RepID=UPI00015EFA6F|nr:Brp/Blh family beta-carotene 15,15'-dioxygenase [Vibrio sp. AND4]EDP60152.1 hypothetical protein AND4_02048 [Vibrio sp. AND4]